VTRRIPGIDRAPVRPAAVLLQVAAEMANGRVSVAAEGDPDRQLTGAIIVAILLAGAGFLVYQWWRARAARGVPGPDTASDVASATAPIPAPAELSGPDLERWATALLIAADELSRTARSAVEMAASGDGQRSVAGLDDALPGAEADLQQAFAIRRNLDAGPSGEDAVGQDMLRGIVELAKRAYEALDPAIRRAEAPGARDRELQPSTEGPRGTDEHVAARISQELAEADRDLRDLRSGLAELGQLDVGVAGRVREVERTLDRAHDVARERPLDPVAALRLATEAHRIAATTLLVAREPDAVAERLAIAADASIQTAAGEVDRATALMASGRRGVGVLARAKLMDARRELAAATSAADGDPTSATDAASRAQQLASEAYQAAEADLAGSANGGLGWGLRSGTDDEATAEIIERLLAR
jgi:hypothetical protein